jgi:hypothetical protein
MEIDSRQPVGASRLRLVDVQIDGDRGHLKFGRHLSGVLTDTRNRSVAARWIAETVVGPRPADSGGRIEVDGNVVSLRSLPSPLLPRSAPIVVDADLIRAEWNDLRVRKRDELAAVHASCRLESYRIDAALDHARARMWPTLAPALRPLEPEGADHVVAPAEPVADAPVAEALPDDVPIAEVPAVDWGRPPDESTRVRAKLHAMVVEYEARDAEPVPEGVLLAAAWDAHTMLVRVREALGALSVDANIEALEERVNTARAAAAMGAGGVRDDARLRIEECHRAVVDAEATLVGARRKERARATTRYEELVAVELVALADAGFESYASFRFTLTAGGAAADDVARRAAEEELAAARAALDAGREIADVPTGLELEEREIQMRARAAQLLGRVPGADPVTELRALRLEPEARDEALVAIADLLRDEGIPTGPDVLSAARTFLAVAPKGEARPKRTAPAAARPNPAAEPVGKPLQIPPNVVDPERSREVADLEEQKWTLDRRLARLEAQLARVDEANAAPVVRLSAADFILTLGSVLDRYEHGDLLAGRLPLVLDGVLDGLSAETREAAVEVFARAEAVQTVVVTHDPEVMQSLARAGATLTRWPEPAGTTTTEPELESSPPSRR